jgi:hypothetical protein
VNDFSKRLGIPMLFGMAEETVSDGVKDILPDHIPLWVLHREILLPWETDRVRI